MSHLCLCGPGCEGLLRYRDALKSSRPPNSSLSFLFPTDVKDSGVSVTVLALLCLRVPREARVCWARASQPCCARDID